LELSRDKHFHAANEVSPAPMTACDALSIAHQCGYLMVVMGGKVVTGSIVLTVAMAE